MARCHRSSTPTVPMPPSSSGPGGRSCRKRPIAAIISVIAAVNSTGQVTGGGSSQNGADSERAADVGEASNTWHRGPKRCRSRPHFRVHS